MFVRPLAVAAPSPLHIHSPADWLENLSRLLKTLKPREFLTVDALLVAVANDFAGGVMLRWLLYWMPKSKRPDGAVYKSAGDWKREVGFTRHQVERLKKMVLPRCGVEVSIQKANGAPTCHYRLNAWKFVRRLSDVLRLPMLYLTAKLQLESSGNPSAGKRTMEMPESGQSLTTNPTNDSPNDVVNDSTIVSLRTIELLKKAGVRGQQYAVLPEAVIEACIQSTQNALDEGRLGPEKRVSYLVAALKNQLKAHGTQTKPSPKNVMPESPADTEAPPPNPLPISAGLTRFLPSRPDVVEKPDAVPESLSVLVNDDLAAHQAWSAAYHQLELQLDRTNFDACLRSARLMDYEPDCFVVKVHTSYARDMLQHRLYRNVARILRDVVGREVNVRFEADEPGAAVGQGLGKFLMRS